MNRQLIKDTVGWGFLLWLFGYILGIVLFMIIPSTILGWIIMPIGIAFTLWVLQKKIKSTTIQNYLFIAIIWTLIAIVSDYLFLVLVFKPADGYYKLDVYLYYVLTFILPVFIWWIKKYKKS